MSYQHSNLSHHYRCLQEYGWHHVNNCTFCQALLKLVEEKWCLNSNTRIPFSSDFGAQYMHAHGQSLTNYSTAFNTETFPGVTQNMNVIGASVDGTYITSPEFSIDWVADASISGSAEQGSRLSYDVSAPWTEGILQEANPRNENSQVHCHTEQPANLAELSFTSAAPNISPSISVVEHLEQGTYVRKQSAKGIQAGPIYFNGGLGVSLESLATLPNGNSPAFDPAADIGEKASVRFELAQLTGYPVQVRVRRGDTGRKGRPITLREMGDTVFKILSKLMDHAERSGSPLQHGGSRVDIERVVLLRVDQVSKGSVQPILGIRSRM